MAGATKLGRLVNLNMHELNLNANKTEYIKFEASTKVSKEKKVSISVNGIQIVEKDECKYLGIKIDKSLSYESQVKRILQKNGYRNKNDKNH